MPKDKMSQLLQCWTVAYEKAIVDKERQFAKKAIDKACCEAVEGLTKLLLDAGSITEEDTVGKRFDTMDDSIRHHISNLEKGGMFDNTEQKLVIKERTEQEAQVVEITVDNCNYQEGCKWALDEPDFRKNGKYRCQRLGCFVGAVKKYMREETLPEDQKNKLDYFMITVMDEDKKGVKCQCKGLVFVLQPGFKDSLLRDYPTQFPASK